MYADNNNPCRQDLTEDFETKTLTFGCKIKTKAAAVGLETETETLTPGS